jgi:hypothetical protein
MRNLLVFSIVALISVTPAWSAPALGDKPKWEYAELYYRAIPGRPGGVDADGNEVPAVPASAAIRLTTSAGDIEAKSWFELAEKLKAAGVKKDSSAALQKIQILNFLGADGWEVIDQQVESITRAVGGFAGGGPGGGGGGGRITTTSQAGGTTWLLKRRVP